MAHKLYRSMKIRRASWAVLLFAVLATARAGLTTPRNFTAAAAIANFSFIPSYVQPVSFSAVREER